MQESSLPLERTERWFLRIESALMFVSLAATFVMMVLTTVDAVSRYALNAPITGAYEVTEKYLMIAMVFLGLSCAYRGGALIRVTFAVNRLPDGIRVWVDHLVQVLTLAFFALLAVATVGQGLRVLENGTALSTLEVPLWPANFLVPLGLAFLCAILAIDLARVRSGGSRLFQEGEPES
ncbi:MAG: TRAP transporter small permease [Burkholderiales bacterium]|nr:TRAP transporter small permease [Burkholderiales bacterium]